MEKRTENMIRNYEIVGTLTTDNSGFSRWGRATCGGRTVFIKEFLTPVYPADDSGLSESLIRSKRMVCQEFYQKKEDLYHRLAECQTGNIIWVEEFFRYGARYYITTEFVQDAVDTINTVKTLSDEKKRIILRLLAYNIGVLHGKGIVHSDIKPNNILVKPTLGGYYTAKLIDFDASFTIDDPPKAGDDVHGDFVYLAPEVFLQMRDVSGCLNEKIDIFSLGLVMHELWCGSLPSFSGEFNYAFEAIVNNETVFIDRSIPADVSRLISRMLLLDPRQRPSAEECFSSLGDPLPVGITEAAKDPTVREAVGGSEAAAAKSLWKRAGDL